MSSDWRKDKRKTGERGYGWKWQKARAAYLKRNHLCVICYAMTPRRLTPANTVDHKTPHRGDPLLFWDQSNWQALCAPCHSGIKQAQEHGNQPIQIGDDGFPIPMGEGGSRLRDSGS